MNCAIIRKSIALAGPLACALAWTCATVTNASAAPNDPLEARASWTKPGPVRTHLPAQVTQSLRPEDVLAYAAPGVLVPKHNIGLQCQGVNATLADIPQRSAAVQTGVGDAALRFGEAELNGVPVFRLEANAHDILAPGTPSRCELISYPMRDYALPSGEVFWWAMSMWADDWSASRDEQLIAQFHVHNPQNLLLNPFFALVVKGNTLRVEVRHNSNVMPTREPTHLVTAARMPMPVRQWITVVVQARMATDIAQGPFLRLWIGDETVANYSGPLGYVLPPGGLAYAKAGIYHWMTGNDWDMAVPNRMMLIGAMLTARDSMSRYTAAQLAATVAPLPRR